MLWRCTSSVEILIVIIYGAPAQPIATRTPVRYHGHMSSQPTPGTWYAVVVKGDRPGDDTWIIRTRHGEATNAPDKAIGWRLAPVAEGRMGNAKRKPDEEQANAYLFAASKEAVRALLALVDSRALSRVEFEAKWGADFDAWKNAAEVIGKAKGEA